MPQIQHMVLFKFKPEDDYRGTEGSWARDGQFFKLFKTFFVVLK